MKKFDQRELIRLAEEYHNAVCKDEKCIIYEKRSPLINLSLEPYWALARYLSYNKWINEFGCYALFRATRTSENIYAKTGIAYHQLSDENNSVNVFKIPLQLQYIYSAYKLMPYISFGDNIWIIRSDEYNEIGNSLSLNAGFNVKVSEPVSLSAGFNSDYTSIISLIMNKDLQFSIISYSFNLGLFIEL